MISKVLIDSLFSHKQYATIINREKYRARKEDIRMIKSQRSDVEKEKSIEEGINIGIIKIIGQNNRAKK